MRRKIAYILLSLSSMFKFLGKMVITKEKTIIIDELTLPGWFIIDECMIQMVVCSDKKLKGVEWRYWDMPEEWCGIMNELKRSKKPLDNALK